MTVRYEMRADRKLTEEQITEIREASKRPICFDEDSPEITEEMTRNAYRPGKKTVPTGIPLTLFLSRETAEKAKSFGDDYISILSSMLDEAVGKRPAI